MILALEARGGWAYSRHTGLADQIGSHLLGRNPVGSNGSQGDLQETSDLSGLWEMKGNGALGVRWAPIYGKLGLMSELPVHFQFYVWGGGGAGTFERESLVVCNDVTGRTVENGTKVGSCGSLGHGEANLENCSSFAAVELMRQGASPLDAGLELLRRIARKAHHWQLGERGEPQFNLWLYLLHKDGRHASVTLRGTKQFAIADERGVRMEECVALFG